MTVDLLVKILGVATSLFFRVVPKVKVWFDKQENYIKVLFQIVVGIIVAWAVYGLSCIGVLDYFTCDKAGVAVVIRLLFDFLVANQATYLMTKGQKAKR